MEPQLNTSIMKDLHETDIIKKEIRPKRTMLEYCKLILGKMKFDRRLFKKEYRKTFRYLTPQEHQELKSWLRKASETSIINS